MRIDADHLLSVAGFDCLKLRFGPDGSLGSVPARAAFVTAEAIKASLARLPAGSGGRMETAILPGDMLAFWRESSGAQAVRVPAGQDAGLAIEHPIEGTPMPFTGLHALRAWRILMESSKEGKDIGKDRLRLLHSLTGFFSIVTAAPDGVRFPDEITGHAFLATMSLDFPDVRTDLPAAVLGRLFRQRLLRAAISRLDPDHPEGLGARTSHTALLNGVPDADRTSWAETPDEVIGHGAAAILPAITSCPMAKIGMSFLGPDTFALAESRLSGYLISGAWIDQVAEALVLASEAEIVVRPWVAAKQGRDILGLRVSHPFSGGLLLSWPSADRKSVLRIGGQTFVTASPEEDPSPAGIRSLEGILRTCSAQCPDRMPA